MNGMDKLMDHYIPLYTKLISIQTIPFVFVIPLYHTNSSLIQMNAFKQKSIEIEVFLPVFGYL